ncbi:hypothetical protein [Bacillus altitudinis]|uniref:hypothetical protein n=1 Tax=Bacillus altitudinis TaxID=293387 RepID=UPI002DBC2087|nr:hypothetical protein [Bacillus altitudinis]MEC0969378.1 hypothetical protein [Bacillus altitudinis]MEC1001936.1 hypothetical protein [Bacillus altitudinis]
MDFTHSEAHWSYTDFHDFRCKLAACIGMNLDDMEGFGGDIPFENFTDDIIPLLNLSDSDSYLMPDVCKTVAVRLRQLIHNWPDDDIDKKNALYLAEGMELAHQQNEPMGLI